jgi:hypothetical protein
MKVTKESHLDHGLTPAQVEYIAAKFADRSAFFIESFELPKELGTVASGLYGPLAGDDPVPENIVEYVVRGTRKGASRMVALPAREQRTVTVIAGPDGDEPCVLYTAYGGPAAPREPYDAPDPQSLAESVVFWADHALAK